MRSALVTGAAGGLGAAIARRLAQEGYRVAIVDTDGAAAWAQASAIPDSVAFEADVTDEASIEAVLDAFGDVPDVLVNNAGIVRFGPLLTHSIEDFRKVLDVNLTGTFLMCRAAATVMIGQGSGGVIVNMGSVFGQQGVAGGAGYSASKAGVALLTHSLALELAPHGIRANTIAPGNMATEMHWDELRSRAARSGGTLDEQVEMVRASVPLGRHGTGGDIAGVVAWLVSPDAGYVTGQTIGVNGGIWLS